MDVVSVSFKNIMWLDLDEDVQIAAGAAEFSFLSFALKPYYRHGTFYSFAMIMYSLLRNLFDCNN